MNILLVHLGGPVPPYFWLCIKQIRNYYDGVIYACAEDLSPTMCSKYGVVSISPNDFIENRVRDFEQVSWFRSRYGAFWDYAFRRLFVIEGVLFNTGISDVLHIENDVLIYSDPRSLDLSHYGRGMVAANDIGPKYATYAYCHIPNHEAMRKLNTANLEILSLGKAILMERYRDSMVNEMLIAKDLMNQGKLATLPFLPPGEIFDGASWGQYAFGTTGDPPGWTGSHHWIGAEIQKGRLNLEWEKGEPFAAHNGERYKIHNLHVHSKKLELGIDRV